jgi:Shikimate kinase
VKNIVLIGFMGVGKGRIGRELAKNLGVFALDCDDLIQSANNAKIKEIFAEFGEEYFRKQEKNLAIFLEKSVKNAVISTGGGFYRVPNLKKIGKIIYLKSDFESIINAINSSPNAQKKIAKRPLLSNLTAAKELFLKREKEYETLADIIIDVRKKSTKDIILQIKKGLK